MTAPDREQQIKERLVRVDEGHPHSVDFIVHAPEDVAYLLEENERLRGEVKRLREWEAVIKVYGAPDLDDYGRVLTDRDRLARRVEELEGVVAVADAMYAANAAKAQAASNAQYQAEFGHDGPSLAGPLGAEGRAYVYRRHQLSRQYPDLPDAAVALGRCAALSTTRGEGEGGGDGD